MAKIIMIAAVGQNGELGIDNHLIWNLKGDLKFFKEATTNHKIVMGYKTFTSLPKLLPNREHLVLTHQDLTMEKVQVFHDFSDLVNYLNSLDEDIYIIGGSSIYKLFLPLADELLLTEIKAEEKKADAYFPPFEENLYHREVIGENRENDISYAHVRLRRKK